MRRLWLILSIVIGLTGPTDPAKANEDSPYLAGRMLVAAQQVLDPNFTQTVIYLLDHNAKGAVGLVINRVIGEKNLNHLLKDFGLTPSERERHLRLHFGGPVSTDSLFILHSPDFKTANTFRTPGGLAMTSDQAILDAFARDDWLNAPADADFVFDASGSDIDVWNAARDRAGLTL